MHAMPRARGRADLGTHGVMPSALGAGTVEQRLPSIARRTAYATDHGREAPDLKPRGP